MMYYTNKARETAIDNIAQLIVKVSEIPGDHLNYTDAGNLIGYLQTMQDELRNEIKNANIHMVGITLKKWKEINPGVGIRKVWAEDTKGSFGKKGQSAYGDCDDCYVVKVDCTTRCPTLWIKEVDHAED